MNGWLYIYLFTLKLCKLTWHTFCEILMNTLNVEMLSVASRDLIKKAVYAEKIRENFLFETIRFDLNVKYLYFILGIFLKV